ncbi:hypothetical protein D3Z47_07560 [Lachnospiraceae bacterium]|jgi:hypothetical protein|nr:hypothetical protein [Lachnospiraceae bacterium]
MKGQEVDLASCFFVVVPYLLLKKILSILLKVLYNEKISGKNRSLSYQTNISKIKRNKWIGDK